MTSKTHTPFVTTFTDTVRHEANLYWQFIKYNVSTTVIPGPIFTIASLLNAQVYLGQMFVVTVISIVHFMLYIYVFDLSGQMDSVIEDRINKPNRPIPCGLISYKGTRNRLMIMIPIFLIEGLLLGVLPENAAWVISFLINNHTQIGKHWIVKNLNMSVGTWAMLAAAWTIGHGNPAVGQLWTIATAVNVFFIVSVQDFRDIEGDSAIDRKTIPIVLGKAARPLTAGLFILSIPYYHYLLYAPFASSSARLAAEGVPAFLLVLVAIRLLFLKSRDNDKYTYIIFTAWYCLHLTAAIIVATGR